MKVPKSHDLRESHLQPLVVAAASPRHRAALDLLMIHAADLAWGDERLGLYVVAVSTLDGHEDDLALASARAELGAIALGREVYTSIRDKVLDAAAGAASTVPEHDGAAAMTARVVSNLVGSEESAMALANCIAPHILGKLGLLVDAVVFAAVDEAKVRRQHQVLTTGQDERSYELMVAALRALDLVEPVVRAALPAGRRPELALTSDHKFVSSLPVDVPTLEILRVEPGLSALKELNELALPVFMAAYINARLLGPPQAFAAARYQSDKSYEIDLAIPTRGLGAEVKLYVAPRVTGRQQIAKRGDELAKQYRSYKALRVSRFVYVTNLSERDAKAVAAAATKKLAAAGDTANIEVVAGSMTAVVNWLDGIVKDLESERERVAQAELSGRMVSSRHRKAQAPEVEPTTTTARDPPDHDVN